MRKRFKRYSILGIILVLGYWLFFSLPEELFHTPNSTVIYSADNVLLGASIADDGQWRFPLNPSIPEKFEKALISFEDERFYYHPGFDIFSIGRALVQNVKEKRVVSGASTISMQVIRLHRRDKPRTWKEKVIELWLATRLELRHSKKEIIALWAAHAPFGGNVVGLEAASWRYYGRSPNLLSWGEAATLAVLPNAPTIIHPGKNRGALLSKRNRLLDKMVDDNVIDSLSAELAKLEPLPDRPKPMPRIAPHLLTHAFATGYKGRRIATTISASLQARVNDLLFLHHGRLSENEIHNAAVLVLDVKTNKIITYYGNNPAGKLHSEDVDIVHAPRSSGSILKPFLFASMNESGDLLPQQLLADIPTQVAGFRPKNFYDKYDGAVPADEALCRSLNIPAVRMLQDYGVERFYQKLQDFNFSTINKHPDHYGLSLILGGAEVTLWDLARAYGNMAYTLNSYFRDEKQHERERGMHVFMECQDEVGVRPVNAGAVYLTLEALTSVKRPNSEFGWSQFSNARKVAWKTGTSIGFRDAWAVGVTPEYIVAVWVGNAEGEGRPDLVGVKAAAPILFDVFRQLPRTSWFEKPYDDLRQVAICTKSGHKASLLCPSVSRADIHKHGRRLRTCPYHKKYFSDEHGRFEVNASCYARHKMKEQTHFALPPIMDYYYRFNHADHHEKLPLLSGCQAEEEISPMDIVYPQPNAKIKVPKELSGYAGRTIFEVAHIESDASVYWHVDDIFVGKTSKKHQLALNPNPGIHKLRIIDDAGIEMRRTFEIVR